MEHCPKLRCSSRKLSRGCLQSKRRECTTRGRKGDTHKCADCIYNTYEKRKRQFNEEQTQVNCPQLPLVEKNEEQCHVLLLTLSIPDIKPRLSALGKQAINSPRQHQILSMYASYMLIVCVSLPPPHKNNRQENLVPIQSIDDYSRLLILSALAPSRNFFRRRGPTN